MVPKLRNVAASVSARLKNFSSGQRANFQRILARYAFERFLYRLSVSPYKELFILKGAMLFAAWLPYPFRGTRDIDLLSTADQGTALLHKTIRSICDHPVIDDGLYFNSKYMVANKKDIRIDGAISLNVTAHLDTAVIPVNIDVGFGDVITPGRQEIAFPVLLDQPAPHLYAYPRETVVAEKFDAIVSLALANSRMKDFYDIFAMSRLFSFDGTTLAAAIRATFSRRGNEIPKKRPPPLTRKFAGNAEKLKQWQTFLARDIVLIDDPDLYTVTREVGDFIMPAALAAIDERLAIGRWNYEQGWSPNK